MEPRVFLVHGYNGRPDNHWFPWLTWELKSRGFEVFSLTMPHIDKPKLFEWISAIKDAVEKSDENTFFVGHSFGCISLLRYLEVLPKTARVGGVVLVAGSVSNIGGLEMESFFLPPLDFEKIKSHSEKFITIFSDNDTHVSLEKSFELQKVLGAKAILERGKGHFTKEEGVVGLPSVFRAIMDMST